MLEGEVVAAEAPHPRAAALGIAERLDGRRLERVEAVGKNLLLTFEGGLVLRSHLRMRGRWQVYEPHRAPTRSRPWLVLRGRRHEAVLWNGPVLQLGRGGVAHLGPARVGPDIMAEHLDVRAVVARLRATGPGREIGDALLDQRLVAGIGNMWRAEALFLAGISPWSRIGDLPDAALERVLREAARAMRAPRRQPLVYRRAGRPCPRWGAPIASRRQGEGARVAYWCPSCQAGTADRSA